MSFIHVILLLYFCTRSDATNWQKLAKDKIQDGIKRNHNTHLAKNVILFIGDGMGVSTITASRIYKGQKYFNKPGEETVLKFEEFPNVALSKTYGADRQVPDSAQTATAFTCGEKTNYKVLGYNENVKTGDCKTAKPENEIYSILHHFRQKGRSTGIVTTARLTDATPAATYAHSVNRDWENDAELIKDGVTGNCTDIAYQLVYNNHDIQVAMGGGRTHFLPNTATEPEYDSTGRRTDGRDLISTWLDFQISQGRTHKYVWNKEQFDDIDPVTTDSVFGLFENSHMQYEVDRDNSSMGEPSIAEMTTKAIQILQKNNKGFFLMVEGGRIDHGHHDSKAARALQETVALEEAVIKAVEMTNQDDTLIIVTADHSHVFMMGGYPYRGNDILGLVDPFDYRAASDGMPYTTLVYGNGPGFYFTVGRENLTHTDTRDPNYVFQSAVPMISETHGGEDVPIFAIGPMSHLIFGVQEQHYVAHVMQYAACVGDYSNDCDRHLSPTPAPCPTSLALINRINHILYITCIVIIALRQNCFLS